MLGMSSATTVQADASQTVPDKDSAKPDSLEIAKAFLKKALGLVKGIPFSPITRKIHSKFSKKSDKPFIKAVAPEAKQRESDDVEDWLNSILAKSEAKAAVSKTEISTEAKKEEVKTSAIKKPVKKAAAKKTVAKKAKGRTR
jgi:hypothetical protein